MKSITLNVKGIKFPATFKTVITKVINPAENSSVVLDSLPHLEISLGETSAASLGLEKGRQVTIKPVDGSVDGSFVLEVGEKETAKPKPVESKGSGPVSRSGFSNNI